ncbi:hypothetical protein BT69DRAFT_862355 [Atractiella rhizophila]|nr:hypothetical protein BT69DRAFT_862355 [Atractiella rhizophila]
MDIPFASEVLLYAYAELSQDVKILLQQSWTLARLAASIGEGDKFQAIVDDADSAVFTAVDVVARSVLGEYNASAVRLNPDFALDEISRSRSPLAAIRLFKKSRRSSPRLLVPSPSGAQSGLTAADEAVQLWSDIYESILPPSMVLSSTNSVGV